MASWQSPTVPQMRSPLRSTLPPHRRPRGDVRTRIAIGWCAVRRPAYGKIVWPPIAQLAEAADLKSAQSGFESLWGDHKHLINVISTDSPRSMDAQAQHLSDALGKVRAALGAILGSRALTGEDEVKGLESHRQLRRTPALLRRGQRPGPNQTHTQLHHARHHRAHYGLLNLCGGCISSNTGLGNPDPSPNGPTRRGQSLNTRNTAHLTRHTRVETYDTFASHA